MSRCGSRTDDDDEAGSLCMGRRGDETMDNLSTGDVLIDGGPNGRFDVYDENCK